MSNQIELTFPPGRYVQGDLYKGSDKDMDGKPRVVKNGPNAGQPSVQYYMAVAIRKGPEQHWSQTPWGQQLVSVGQAASPNVYQHPSFAWKVTDGDSGVSSKPGRAAPNSNEGWPGHWVVKCTSGFPPAVYQRNPSTGQPELQVQVGAVNPGDFVQVAAVIRPNGSDQSPGIFINHRMVLLQGYGTRILSAGAPDPTKANFDLSGALPAGASATPLASAMPASGIAGAGLAAGGVGGLPAAGVGVAGAVAGLPGVGGGIAGAGVGVGGVAVNPNPGILGAGVGGLAPLGQLAPQLQLTPAAIAQGVTLDVIKQHIAAGQTEANLRAAGYLI